MTAAARFKVGDIIEPKTNADVRHEVIGIKGNVYQLKRLNGRGLIDEYEIELVDYGGRKLTKLELALK